MTKIATANQRPYRLGLALSGGGARGFAHAGALMAIEEAGLRPDAIAGVSAGSVIAVLYSAGIKPLDMAHLFANKTFKHFAELNFGDGGLFRIDKFKHFIYKTIGEYRNLEDLPIPTYIGVTNLDKGEAAYFDRGEIGPRMIASCSIPIVFKPVQIDGHSYVDGGVLRNHPAWILRDKCQTLIGINVSPLSGGEKYNSLISVAMRTYHLMAKATHSHDMELCDINIQTPDIADYATFDLKHIKNVFVSGYIHARRALRDANLWAPQGIPPVLSNLNVR